jgi:hypothetical protein
VSGSDRSRRVRAFAHDLSDRLQADIKATYDSGSRWYLEWVDGPTRATVRAAVDTADLAGAQIRTARGRSVRAAAVAAVRLAAAGEFTIGRRWGVPLSQIEHHLDDIDHPEQTVDEREEHMVGRLLAAATPPGQHWPDDYRIGELVAENGLAWLLDGARLTPLEVLTARYAQGEAARAWRERTETMPVRPAVEAALTDPNLEPAAALATLTLLRELRVDQERAEAAAIAAARRAEVSWADIGTALGVSKQSAHKWGSRRAAGASSRASAQG